LQSDEMKKGSRFLPGKRTGPRGGDENWKPKSPNAKVTNDFVSLCLRNISSAIWQIQSTT